MSIAHILKKFSSGYKICMKIFVADECANHTKIEILSGVVGLYQEPISKIPFIESKTLDASDAVLVPHDAYYFHKYPDYLEYLNELAKKRLIVFSDRGDFPKKPKITNSVALRVAINPGESLRGKIVIPYNVQSLSFLPYRELREEPTISFVGYMPKISLGRAKHVLQQSPLHPIKGNGGLVRRLTNEILKSSNLDYKTLIRSSYGAFNDGKLDLNKNRSEYINAMNDSDFVVCPRGDANQSARFYETLSAGRIPLIPDTSIIFPEFDGKLQNDLFIEFRLLHRDVNFLISKYFSAFTSQSDYVRMQERLRETYQKNFHFETVLNRVFGLEIGEFLNLAKLSKH